LFPQFITIVQEEPIIIQLTIVIVPLVMATPISNVLIIQLPLYQIDDDPTSHLQQLTKICVTNGENTNVHKLRYFPYSLKKIKMDWFDRYATMN
jgi:hypothetical protein